MKQIKRTLRRNLKEKHGLKQRIKPRTKVETGLINRARAIDLAKGYGKTMRRKSYPVPG